MAHGKLSRGLKHYNSVFNTQCCQHLLICSWGIPEQGSGILDRVPERGLQRTRGMEREIEHSMGVAAWLCFGMVQAAVEQQGEEYEGCAKHWEGHRISEVHFCCTAKAFELHPAVPVSHRHFTLSCRGIPSLSPCTQQLITPKVFLRLFALSLG